MFPSKNFDVTFDILHRNCQMEMSNIEKKIQNELDKVCTHALGG